MKIGQKWSLTKRTSRTHFHPIKITLSGFFEVAGSPTADTSRTVTNLAKELFDSISYLVNSKNSQPALTVDPENTTTISFRERWLNGPPRYSFGFTKYIQDQDNKAVGN